MSGALRRIEIARVGTSGTEPTQDVAAVEEPLELRVNGAAFVVIMRTPGADRELAAGFLLAERIVSTADDLGAIRHCTGADGSEAPNVLDVRLAGEASARYDEGPRRATAAVSACGVCGRRTIDDLLADLEPMRASWRVPRRLIATLPAALRERQEAFAESGGLHGAALFDRDGRLVASAEDVGRHNAVDKVIGRELLADCLPLEDRLLCVSGRTGYEIVQKALVARIPVVASVSAPSSLAIDLARSGGLTLLGFVRGGGFNIYAGSERIDVA